MMSRSPEWQERIEAYCAAWTTQDGPPDFDKLSRFYADDPDIVLYDSMPPIEGFAGFEAVRKVYPDLERLVVTPNKDVRVWILAEGQVAVTTHTYRQSTTLRNGSPFVIDARQSDVWERRDGRWRIIHEHSSTVVTP